MKQLLALAAGLMLLAGCFTVSETPFPTITFRSDAAVATNTSVSVQGFATTLTEYTMVDGYQTVFYDCGPWPYGNGGMATAHTTTIVPHTHPSDAFLDQAKNRLEDLGFNIMARTPDYVVEARFSGPYRDSGDTSATAAWLILSLLTCDHGAQTWSARLKIHDNRTGRLVFSREYSQKHEVTGFSPIPLFGISYYDRTDAKYMQCWCLSALTERMMADTAEFLTGRK